MSARRAGARDPQSVARARGDKTERPKEGDNMAAKAKKHLVDGEYKTVGEMAEALGVSPQQIYSQIHHKGVSPQVAVNMIRENLVLNNQGRAIRYMVDGKWMTIRQAAEGLGITWNALTQHMYRHKCTLAEAVNNYRAGAVRHYGHPPVQHRVGNKTMTTFEAAEKLGVSVNAVRIYMYKHKTSLAATIRHYEKRKMKQAEKAILAILMEKRQ